MFKKRYMFVLILLITLTTLSAVSASDLNTTNEMIGDVLSTVSASDLNTTDEMIGDELSTYDELEQTEDIILDASGNTFTDLNNLISSSGSTVTLNRDYEYVCPDDGDFQQGILISKDLTINGNGHTIYANGARAFVVLEDADVTINGVNFINDFAYTWASGGTIYNLGSLTLINCEFTNSSAAISGGAVYSDVDAELEIYSCEFTHNELWYSSDDEDSDITFGGAIYSMGSLFISDSYFALNCVEHYGGAIVDTTNYAEIEDCIFFANQAGAGGAIAGGNAYNCEFAYNTAEVGGAIFMGYAEDCFFTKNYADNGGAMYEGYAMSCEFIDNHADTHGGAMYNCSAGNCIFINNTAESWGGAMEDGYAFVCKFIGNDAYLGGAMHSGSEDTCYFVNNTAYYSFAAKYYGTEIFNPILSVSDLTSNYNSGDKLIVNFTTSEGILVQNVDVTIDVYKDGAFVGTYNCISDDGWVVNLPVGTYVALVNVNPGFLIDPVNVTIKINKEKTKITSQKTTVAYNDGGVLVATLTSADTGKAISDTNLVFKLNDKKYTIKTDSKGQAKLSLGDLSPKEYTISISYAGNSKYASSSKSVTVIVNKAETSISAFADDTELVATLTHKSTGKAISGAKLVANINGKSYSLTTDSNGEAILPSPSKEYTATISYAGNSKYKSSSKTIATKTKTAITAVYDADKNVLTATLTKGAQGKALSGVNVLIEINGKTTTVKTNSNGQAKISPEGLPYGTYQATISYNGNTNYNAAKTRIDFTTKTVVIVTDVYAYSDRIVAKLTNGATGKTIANANMIVEINGVKYNVKSDNKGLLTFDTTGLNLPDSFDLTISYRGNDRYTASSATVAVDLNKANMMITTNYHADKQKLVATLKNSKTGKVVSNANMIIDLNGVKTTYKSNDQGKITLLTADFAPGTYVGTVTYQGNARYNSISAVFKVDV